MNLEVWHLILYALVVGGLALYLILRKNPAIIRGLIKTLLHEEFIEAYQEQNREKLRDILVTEIKEVVVEEFQKMGVQIDFTEDFGSKLQGWMNSWYANLHKKMQAEAQQSEQAVKEAGELMAMNEGNAQAQDIIMQRALQGAFSRSPYLGLALQYMMGNQGGRQGGSSGGIVGGQGGY